MHAEKISLAEHDQTTKHCQPDNEQERRLKEEMAVSHCEIPENQAEQNKPHAMTGIEGHPTPPHGCLFRNHSALRGSNSSRFEGLLLLSAKNDAYIAANTANIAELQTIWNDVSDGIERLVHTAEMHQRRLDNHDERLDNLEGT
jgi:hypothetical protein